MRRALLRGDIDITASADVIYRAAFGGEPLPKDWRVVRTKKAGRRFGGRTSTGLGDIGRCSWGTKTILMFHRAWKIEGSHSSRAVPGGGWLAVLIHEFIHQRCPDLKHGKEFNRLTATAYARVWS